MLRVTAANNRIRAVGCDIHFFVEYDRLGNPAFADPSSIELEITGDFNLARDYDLFAALAGVRTQIEPKFKPRGFPKSVSKSLFSEYFSYVLDCGEQRESEHDELREHANTYVEKGYSEYRDHPNKKNGWISCPDWHTPSWLFVAEIRGALRHHNLRVEQISNEFLNAINVLENLESMFGINRARAVFWFDN